jgi:hypothetical protein
MCWIEIPKIKKLIPNILIKLESIDVKIDYFADKNYGSIQRSMKTTYNILTWDDPKEKAEWG